MLVKYLQLSDQAESKGIALIFK